MNHPSAFIPRDRLQSIINGTRLPEETVGSVLFADVVGYTKLIESVLEDEKTVSGGVSKVAQQINAIFERMIVEVHKYGGSVVAFGGDAITAWFEGDTGITAIACGHTMYDSISQHRSIEVDGELVAPRIKISIASGPAQHLVLGNENIQMLDVLTGEVMSRLAQATHHAEHDKIIVEKETAAKLRDEIEICGWSTKEGYDDTHAIVGEVISKPAPADYSVDEFVHGNSTFLSRLKPWLLAPIYERLTQSKTNPEPLSAKIRLVVVLFLKFADVKAENNIPVEASKIKEYVRAAQSTLEHYHGSLIKVTFDDKGSYLLATFGAPSVDVDAEPANQALSAALALRALTTLDFFSKEIYIGISQGRMLVGPFGSTARAAYDLLGSETNIANRLMNRAGKNEILVSKRVQKAVDRRYSFDKPEEFPDLNGIDRTVTASHLLSEQVPITPTFELLLIGREPELRKLMEWRALAFEGYGSFVLVEGEAGIGKSHLIAEFHEQTVKAGAISAWGSCVSTQKSTPYYVWEQVLNSIMNGISVFDAQAQAPLIADINKILRQISTPPATLAEIHAYQAIISEQTVSFIDALAGYKPLFFVIDNAQWIDEASRELLTALSRGLESIPLMIVLAYRPNHAESINAGNREKTEPLAQGINIWRQFAPVEQLPLGALTEKDVAILVGETRKDGEPSPLLNGLCWKLSSGNPLYVTELIHFLSSHNLIEYQAGQKRWDVSKDLLEQLKQHNCIQTESESNEPILIPDVVLSERVLNIPDRLYALVQAHIARVPTECEDAFHLASVIGPTFDFTLLAEAHFGSSEEMSVGKQIEILLKNNIITKSVSARDTYSFKTSIAQEINYNNLPKRTKQEYHKRIGNALEKISIDAVELLAYHYNLSGERDKQLQYLDLAARKSQNESANQTALSFYNQALGVEERAEWLQGKIEVLHILGDRREQTRTLGKLGRHHERSEFVFNYLYGQYQLAVTDYETAEEYAVRALENAIKGASDINRAKSLALLSRIMRHQSKYDQGISYAEEGLELISSTKHLNLITELHNSLGNIYRDQINHELAEEHSQAALTLAKQIDDRLGSINALNIKAAIAYRERSVEQARGYVQQIIQNQRAIGDLAGEAISLYNFGLSAHHVGAYDSAEEYVKEAIKIIRGTKDVHTEINAQNLLGVLKYEVGEYDAASSELEIGEELCKDSNDEIGLAYTKCNLGLVVQEDGRMQAAKHYLEHSRSFAKDKKDPYLEALCSSYLALIHLKDGNPDEAIQLATRSQELRHHMELESMTTIDLTTLARAYQQKGDSEQALNYANLTLDLLDTHAGDGPEYPHWDYYHCFQVLLAIGETPIARDALLQAHTLLMQRAMQTKNKKIRDAYLHNGPTNGKILDAYEQHHQ